MDQPFAILHRISLPDPKTHLVHVEMRVGPGTRPLPDALVVFMAVWTPGSYLVREYERHVEGLDVDAPARVAKVRKNAWRIEAHDAKSIVVRYRVYAAELTVRTSHVDDTHAFLVGAGVFLGVEGHEHVAARVEIQAPRDWRVATQLPVVGGAFEAADYGTLVDTPIEIGTHREERFEVLGKKHTYLFWPPGAVSNSDAKRLVDDTRKALETEAKLFGGDLPYPSYQLMLHLSPRGRGGLEHLSSAALIAPLASFATREAYLDLLSLVAHEVFHAWNVKRIRPAGLTPYRYQEECYTRLLWWFEGATSYYDWRVLALSRLCTIEEYLDHLALEIAYLDQTPGRLVHALEEASFDAWIKLYRPDENSLNSSVSYYRKGEIVCALLDLEIRARTGGRSGLDAILLHLWREYGKPGRAVPEDGMQAIFESVAGVPLDDLFDAWIRSPAEIDCGATLARVGLSIERSSRSESPQCSLGMRLRNEGGRTVVASVMREGAAWRAGVDPGDEIVGIGGLRAEGASVDAVLRGRSAGDVVEILLARDGRLLTKQASLDPQRHDRVKILAQRDASAAAREAFAAWLGAPHPAWTKAEAGA
jgi:predicted metalloprotease with PDZ domain